MTGKTLLGRAGSGGICSETGVAIVVAIVAAIVVSLTAAIVLSVTLGRLHLTAFQADHTIAFYASEAGVQYVFHRLQSDTTSDGLPTEPNGFRDDVRYGDQNPPYVITSYRAQDRATLTVTCGGQTHNGAPEERTNDLFMGFLNHPVDTNLRKGKELIIGIMYEDATGRYRICSVSDFATGQ